MKTQLVGVKKKRFIKIPKDFFKSFDFKISVPTFRCSCGEIVLDTLAHRLQSSLL